MCAAMIVCGLSNNGLPSPTSRLCFKVGSGEAILDGQEDPEPAEGLALFISPFFWDMNGVCAPYSVFCPVIPPSTMDFSDGISMFPEV